MTAQTILVPTDFSDYANQALDYAIELAKVHQASLTLLHVIDTTAWGNAHAEDLLPPSYRKELETRMAASMEATRRRVKEAGLPVETLICHGAPFQAIIDTAKNEGVDLIIMCTHGQTGITHALMGSVSEKVVRLAPCPVLVTRGTTEEATT